MVQPLQLGSAAHGPDVDLGKYTGGSSLGPKATGFPTEIHAVECSKSHTSYILYNGRHAAVHHLIRTSSSLETVESYIKVVPQLDQYPFYPKAPTSKLLVLFLLDIMNTKSNLTKYIYRPLETAKHIRVIILKPAPNFNDKLDVSLVHADREDVHLGKASVPFYEAMSYCWGDSPFTYSLEVENEARKAVLTITKNVDGMLRYFRRSHKPRYLWIDAICLNQNDDTEKLHQIHRMRDIYRQSTKVHVWLGTSIDDNSYPIFTALKRVAMEQYASYGEQSQEYRRILNRVCGENYVRIFDDFFSRSWFTRRWVIQEVAFGTDITIHCGNYKLAWPWFVRGITNLSRQKDSGHHTVTIPFFPTLKIISERRSQYLIDVLWDCHESDCLLPEDRIYAINSISRDPYLGNEVPSPWYKMFEDIARRHYQHLPSEMIKHLICFGSIFSFDNNYPSWVPDWRNRRRRHYLVEKLWVSTRQEKPSNPNSRELDIYIDWSGTIVGFGTSFSQVLSACAAQHHMNLISTLLALVLDDSDNLLPSFSPFESHTPIYKRLLLKVIAHLQKIDVLGILLSGNSPALVKSSKNSEYDHGSEVVNAIPQALESLFKFYKMFLAKSAENQLYLGFGPVLMMEGDQVIHPNCLGTSLPVLDFHEHELYVGLVVRASKFGRNKIIGHCFFVQHPHFQGELRFFTIS